MEMRSHVITTSQRLDNIVFILRFGATTDRIDRQSFFDTSRIVAMQQLDWERLFEMQRMLDMFPLLKEKRPAS